MKYSWILDSGGTGRGAWQGGVIYEFMQWCRQHDTFPFVTMGASAGGYAAADVATGTEKTVMKGWTYWGTHFHRPDSRREKNRFRGQLLDSIHYVMAEDEVDKVFQENPSKRLAIFTTRVRRRDGKPFQAPDRLRFFLKSATRKLPGCIKYLPGGYIEDPVVFALNLPHQLRSEFVRPLTRSNYHRVIEASCLIPMAMGSPLLPEDLTSTPLETDHNAVFIDGGYSLKMPFRLFEEDPRFMDLSKWISADKTIIFCCDPAGYLWETSSRLRQLNNLPGIVRAARDNRLLIVRPDHKIEAGFLCMDNAIVMRTFQRGREQALRLLGTEAVQRFFDNT